MQPASRGESVSLLITHLFKTMNCLETSDGHAAASSSKTRVVDDCCTCRFCPWVSATVVEGLRICLVSPSLGEGEGDVLLMFGKVDALGSLVACWCLEPISSSRTTSAFPAVLCVAVSLVTSCASLLRWPACSFSSSSCESAGHSGFKCCFLQGNNYF